MNILLTGATSLTGFWFASALRDAGHSVLCLLTRPDARAYDGKQRERFRLLQNNFQLVFDASFGSPRFIDELSRNPVDLLCLHGAHIPDYRSQEFDIASSLGQNLRAIAQVFKVVAERRLPVMLTGTVFEPGQGGAGQNPPGSPYGLAKGIITQVFRFYSDRAGTSLGHFVVPNPFGPFEDPKFTHYLAKSWFHGEVPEVKTPDYVRDNIPAPLLAMAYQDACEQLMQLNGKFIVFKPSGYREKQGEFALRVAREFAARTSFSCSAKLNEQKDFTEPMARYNDDSILERYPQFSEKKFWDQYVDYYRTALAGS
ncbi:MAG: NAD-dependent epimerase/dehydratase family protein [Spirochaetota bacterium]